MQKTQGKTMRKTNWQKVMKRIMGEKSSDKGVVMTYFMVSKKTGICISTLSRLATIPGRILDYDAGLALIRFHDSLK